MVDAPALLIAFADLHCRRASVQRPTIDIAVLASGSGTNLQALIDTPSIRERMALVLSDRADATALTRATAASIPTDVVSWPDFADREAFCSALAGRIADSGAKGVVLAGFMRILSPSFVEQFPMRILNIHPSLLPAFPGAGAVEAALAHGVKTTGVTVHFVDEQVDHGPIIAQVAVPVVDGDDPASLHSRIQEQEHHLYPMVVEAFVEGRLSVEGRSVIWA